MKRATPRTKKKKAAPGVKPVSKSTHARTKSKVSPRTRRPAAKRKTAMVKKSAAVKSKSSPNAKTPLIRRKMLRKKPAVKIPSFLLAGDEVDIPAVAGPGEKFSLGPTTPEQHLDAGQTSLPAAYGTGRLFVTARDPHWLYAHWDLTHQQQFRHNAQSVDRHMILRVFDADAPENHIAEVHVHPESRHWFTHVERAGEKYVVELGYYRAGRKWKSLATSQPARTPPETISTDSNVEFATIPLELSFETMLRLLKESDADAGTSKLLLARAVKNLPAKKHFVPAIEAGANEWTPEQDRALADFVTAHQSGVALCGSEESGEIMRGNEEENPGSFADVPGEASSFISSFYGGEQGGGKDFWFNVNAELVIYGSTEADANVTIGGRKIALKQDGSFSYRFALPDGAYELPVVAISADGTDGRAAELKFSRSTQTLGHVGEHPQDPALQPPTPENL